MRNGTHIININTGKKVGEPREDKSDIITTIFRIIPHNRAGRRDFKIYVDNFKEYLGTDATFSPELISHLEYNFYKYENPWTPRQIEVADVVKTSANQKPNYNLPAFEIYSFGFNSDYFKDAKTGKPLRGPAEGTKMTVKVTVKMNGKSQDFTVDIVRKGFTETYTVEGKLM